MMPIKSMKQTKVIILDFDGVIVESVGIKDRAFNELYQGHPDHIDAIMSYHLAHNATIRFKKFKYISENILKRTYTLEDERLLSNRFSDLIFKEIVACPYVPGALEFLESFHGKLPMYLVSMSPQTELMRILEQRNLTRYFFEVFSSDWKKIDAINFAPMNKTSLKLGGNKHSDELQLMAEKLEVNSFCCEFNVIDNFWTARVTSHIPIKEVAQHITKENIMKPIKLINEVMELNGVKNPRIAIQALNPHAEFGTEEKDEIIPAIEEAKTERSILELPTLKVQLEVFRDPKNWKQTHSFDVSLNRAKRSDMLSLFVWFFQQKCGHGKGKGLMLTTK